MMYGWGSGAGYGMGIWMLISWIIMAVVIIFALYGLIAIIRKSETGRFTNKSLEPMEYLKERLAKGEISHEEYQKIKEELLK